MLAPSNEVQLHNSPDEILKDLFASIKTCNYFFNQKIHSLLLTFWLDELQVNIIIGMLFLPHNFVTPPYYGSNLEFCTNAPTSEWATIFNTTLHVIEQNLIRKTQLHWFSHPIVLT